MYDSVADLYLSKIAYMRQIDDLNLSPCLLILLLDLQWIIHPTTQLLGKSRKQLLIFRQIYTASDLPRKICSLDQITFS